MYCVQQKNQTNQLLSFTALLTVLYNSQVIQIQGFGKMREVALSITIKIISAQHSSNNGKN